MADASLIEKLEALKPIDSGSGNYDQDFSRGVNKSIAVVNAHQPEPVSLEACIAAMQDARRERGYIDLSDATKAVLTAAGVKWRE